MCTLVCACARAEMDEGSKPWTYAGKERWTVGIEVMLVVMLGREGGTIKDWQRLLGLSISIKPTSKKSQTGQRTRETHNNRKVTPGGRRKKTEDGNTTHRHTHKRIQGRTCLLHP